MSVRRTVWVACSLGLVLLASCQQGTNQTAPAGGGGAHGDAVVVASFNFPESELLAAIYGLAIRHAGIPVQLQLDLGPRELVQPALEQGLVDVVPEYLGTALTSLGPHPGVLMPDLAAVKNALARALARWHVQVMTPAAAQDQNGMVVTDATARRLGLHTVSDLRRVAGRADSRRCSRMPGPALLPCRAAAGIRAPLRQLPALRHRDTARHRAGGRRGRRRGAGHYRREPGHRRPGPARG